VDTGRALRDANYFSGQPSRVHRPPTRTKKPDLGSRLLVSTANSRTYAFSALVSVQRVLGFKLRAVLGTRSRKGALRDDSKGALRDDTPICHPDNVPGQDPCLSRKRDRPLDPVSPSFRLQRSASSEERLFDGRSRTGALRDDSMGESRDDTASRHPDNSPGQDLGLCRVFETRSRAKASRDDRRGAKKGQTLGPGQSLFSLTAMSGFSFFSA